jgi:hypothetical protein
LVADSSLLGFLWIEVVFLTTNYLVNRSPTMANLGVTTKEETYKGLKLKGHNQSMNK